MKGTSFGIQSGDEFIEHFYNVLSYSVAQLNRSGTLDNEENIFLKYLHYFLLKYCFSVHSSLCCDKKVQNIQ